MSDKEPYVCGCKEEDWEFFCDKDKPYMGEPIIKINSGTLGKVIATIVAIPIVLCLGLICVAVAIGPVLIGFCAMMIGLVAAAIGSIRFVIEWTKAKVIFHFNYYLWRIKRKFWLKKKNL